MPADRARAARRRASARRTRARPRAERSGRPSRSRPASAMPTFCQLSPTTTPSGVHASGTSRAVIAPARAPKAIRRRRACCRCRQARRRAASSRGLRDFDRQPRALRYSCRLRGGPGLACERLRQRPRRIQTGQTRNARFDRRAANLVVVGEFARPFASLMTRSTLRERDQIEHVRRPVGDLVDPLGRDARRFEHRARARRRDQRVAERRVARAGPGPLRPSLRRRSRRECGPRSRADARPPRGSL